MISNESVCLPSAARTFNIADMAVSLGAFLLAWVLWGEDTERENVPAVAPAAVTAESRELS
jgi:hypothetical protein